MKKQYEIKQEGVLHYLLYKGVRIAQFECENYVIQENSIILLGEYKQHYIHTIKLKLENIIPYIDKYHYLYSLDTMGHYDTIRYYISALLTIEYLDTVLKNNLGMFQLMGIQKIGLILDSRIFYNITNGIPIQHFAVATMIDVLRDQKAIMETIKSVLEATDVEVDSTLKNVIALYEVDIKTFYAHGTVASPNVEFKLVSTNIAYQV